MLQERSRFTGKVKHGTQGNWLAYFPKIKRRVTVTPKWGECDVLSRHHHSHFTSPHFSTETDPLTTITTPAPPSPTWFIKSTVAAASEVWQKQLGIPNSRSFFLNKKTPCFGWALGLLGGKQRLCFPASFATRCGYRKVSQANCRLVNLKT